MLAVLNDRIENFQIPYNKSTNGPESARKVHRLNYGWGDHDLLILQGFREHGVEGAVVRSRHLRVGLSKVIG